MENFLNTLKSITDALQGQDEQKAGLYGALFGAAKIPVVVDISKETRNTVIIAAAIITAGAIVSTFIATR